MSSEPEQPQQQQEQTVEQEETKKEDEESKIKKEEEETKPSEEETPEASTEEKKEEKKEDGQEMTAVAALTSLNGNSSDKGSDDEEKEDAKEEDDAEIGDDSNFTIPLRLTKSGRRRATPFPLKLMKVLSTKEFTEVIAWTPSGKAFNILQPKVFVATILPEHFKSAKYSSFTRKLHRWGFMRHYRGPEAGAFFHKNFRRGRMDLVEKMTCYKPAAPSTPSSSKANNSGANNARLTKMLDDHAPAMDTSASSRHSGSLSGPNSAMAASMMGNLGLQLPGGFNALMPHQAQNLGLPQQLAFMQGFGGMSPMQQQQFFLQQQAQHKQQFQQQQQQFQQQQFAMQQQQMQQAAVAQQQQQLPLGGGAPSTGETGLDAAIEMEVTRRLKERINAAALSRQGQQGPLGGGASPQMTQMQPMDGGRGAFGGMFGNATGGGAPNGGSYAKALEAQGFGAQAAASGMDPFGMSSNIQGAKTA